MSDGKRLLLFILSWALVFLACRYEAWMMPACKAALDFYNCQVGGSLLFGVFGMWYAVCGGRRG
jgi:hypothetical protein